MDSIVIKSKFILGSVSESLESTIMCIGCKQLPNPNSTQFCPRCMSVVCAHCLKADKTCRLCKQQSDSWSSSNIHWEKDFSKLVFKCECGFADRWINFTHQCATDALQKLNNELDEYKRKNVLLTDQFSKLKDEYREIENVLNYISNKRKVKTEYSENISYSDSSKKFSSYNDLIKPKEESESKEKKENFSNYYQLLKDNEENDTSTNKSKDNNKTKNLMRKKTKNEESSNDSDNDSIDREAMKELTLENMKKDKDHLSKTIKSKHAKDNTKENETNEKRKREKEYKSIDMSDFDNYHIGNLDFNTNVYQIEKFLNQNEVKHAEIDVKKGYAFTFAESKITFLNNIEFKNRKITISEAKTYNSIWIKVQNGMNIEELDEYIRSFKKYQNKITNDYYTIYVYKNSDAALKVYRQIDRRWNNFRMRSFIRKYEEKDESNKQKKDESKGINSYQNHSASKKDHKKFKNDD